jgi:hypothetical protein
MLDAIPHIPWAFALSEYLIMALIIIFGIILATHRHRAVIFRRFCLIYGNFRFRPCKNRRAVVFLRCLFTQT